MIKLFKVKEKQREIAENANGKAPVKKQSAGELRLHKDISELNLPKTCSISFPNGKDDLMNFEVTIRPDEGYYLGGTFLFSFQVSPIYPHEAPKQPNYEDPLNHDAAAVLRDNPKLFESNVRRAMAGGYVGQTFFTRCM
ncbi:Ubiquitin-conjugating enzyme E2 - like 10 [Theobroma cacao]|nr:Ubiquitin-conjugating enzyme E2 - like 10 [Theobroma cacao]